MVARHPAHSVRMLAAAGRTEHVLQADDAGEIVIKVDAVLLIGKPQAE